MSIDYPLIPPYLEKGLEDLSIPLIDLLHGHLKVAMIESEVKLERCDQDDEREWLDGYMQALTDTYALTYNLSIDRAQLERANG
jgi:hypothetical protein